jgi:hypothetical protein
MMRSAIQRKNFSGYIRLHWFQHCRPQRYGITTVGTLPKSKRPRPSAHNPPTFHSTFTFVVARYQQWHSLQIFINLRYIRLLSLSISSSDAFSESIANPEGLRIDEIPHVETTNAAIPTIPNRPFSYTKSVTMNATINGVANTNDTPNFSLVLPDISSFDDHTGIEEPLSFSKFHITEDIDVHDDENDYKSSATFNSLSSSIPYNKIGDDDRVSRIGDNENDQSMTNSYSESIQQQQQTTDDTLPNYPPDLQKQLASTESSPIPGHNISESPYKHPLVSRLIKCVYSDNIRGALQAFNKIMEMNKRHVKDSNLIIDISPGLTKALFRLVSPKHTFQMYHILQYYITLPTSHENSNLGGNINTFAIYFRSVCDSIRYFDLRTHSYHDMSLLVVNMMDRISRFDHQGKELCVPVLLSALCEQQVSAIGEKFSGHVYKYMLANNISVPNGYWVHLLSFSSYNRHYHIPYDEILTRTVEFGLRPAPSLVLNVLENFFPFSNSLAVEKTLKALLTLQRQVAVDIKTAKAAVIQGSARGNNGTILLENTIAKQYFVDVHVLEMIGAAAASHGYSEICLLIWEMIDVLEYQPTEGIYENTVVAFAMNSFTYREAFTVLHEMESRGFVPSRALIRSFSVHVR